MIFKIWFANCIANYRLPFLSVKIPDAKALRYFRLCDTDGSGEIDIDEFKVALFICDPVSSQNKNHNTFTYLSNNILRMHISSCFCRLGFLGVLRHDLCHE